MAVPTRQGSPRGPNDTGRIIFQRKYSPWHDPRLIHGGSLARIKKKFLKRLFFQEAQAWANISRARRQQGVNCCTFCAGDPPEVSLEDHSNYGFSDSEDSETEISDLCWQCEDDLDCYGQSIFSLKWIRRQLVRGHYSSGAEALGTDTLEYNITTPPMSPFRFRRLPTSQTSSDSDEDDLLEILENFDDKFTAGDGSDKERRSLSNTETPSSPGPFDPEILKQLSRPLVFTQGNDETSILGKRKRR
jgi:hypothetical protein